MGGWAEAVVEKALGVLKGVRGPCAALEMAALGLAACEVSIFTLELSLQLSIGGGRVHPAVLRVYLGSVFRDHS